MIKWYHLKGSILYLALTQCSMNNSYVYSLWKGSRGNWRGRKRGKRKKTMKTKRERTSKGGWKLLGVFWLQVNKATGRDLTWRVSHNVPYLPLVSHPTFNLHTTLSEKKPGDVKSKRYESASKENIKQGEEGEGRHSIKENEGQQKL